MNLDIFKNKKPDFNKLQAYGFDINDTQYTYHTTILDGQFEMYVYVFDDGNVDTKIIDRETNDEYVLHRTKAAAGSFIGLIRDAHTQVLQTIADTCFDADIFKSKCAHELIRYVRQAYGDDLEFLWKKFPDNAIWRRKDTKKWYAVLLTVSKRKLGINSDEIIEIIDLRIKPEELEKLVDNKKYYPGYHMNKKHWYTIILDNSVPAEEICARLDESYSLAVK